MVNKRTGTCELISVVVRGNSLPRGPLHNNHTRWDPCLMLHIANQVLFLGGIWLRKEQCSGCSRNIVQRYLRGSLHSHFISTVFWGFPGLGSH